VLDALFPDLAQDLIHWLRGNALMDQHITPPAQARLIPRSPNHPLASMVLQEHLIARL